MRKPEGSLGTSRVRASTVAWLALFSLVSWSGCRGESEPLTLGGETNWLAWCEGDADCAVGACVCGVCAAPCATESTSCDAGPPASACFADGSFGHAALCEGGSSAGICLPVCAASTECPEGTTCAAGACLPSAAGTPGSGPEPTGSMQTDVPGTALGEFSQDWLGDFFGQPRLPPDSRSYAEACPPDAPCPTLEQLLSMDVCYDARAGCGLLFIGNVDAIAGSAYWYDGFGVPPVAVYNWSDVGGGLGLAATRPIDCDAIDVMCSTCGRDAPGCEDLAGVFPEPPTPAPVPGCACELDGQGGARVSMECFCSIYDCPTYSELALACREEVPRSVLPSAASIDACGQVWLSTGAFTEQRLAFDAQTGALIGATAALGGPVTAPCSTYRVTAGAASDCAEVASCGCTADGDCADAYWLDP